MYFSNSRVRRLCGAVAAALFSIALPGIALADLNEEQKLSPTLNPSALAGHSTAIAGDTAVVGAPGDTGDLLTGCAVGGGAAYVYTRAGTVWTKVATLCASDGALNDEFGDAVSISGGNIAVGAPGRGSGVGAVYVYTGSGATWTENGTILTAPLNGNAHLGSDVSIQGFRVASGAPNTTVGGKTNVGIVAVWDSNDSGATWLRQTFRPNGGQARNGSLFGTSVAVDGSTVLVGAPGYHTGNKQNSGSVFVFVNNGGTWTQQAGIRPSNTANLYTGTSVSLFQNTAAFGAPGASSNRGTAYVYTRSGTSWSQTDAVTASNGAAGDQFGTSVSIQGSPFTALAVGAPFANSNGGRAYEFGSTGGGYSQLNELIATDNLGGDQFGTSVDLDAGRIIVGAPNNLVTGAAYVFKFRNESVTAVTGFSVTPSLTNVPYDVTVTVTDGTGGTGTPTGSVGVDDGHGGSCTATLAPSGDPDGHAVGTCSLTTSFFGTVTVTGSFGGDVDFASSSGSAQHDVTGNHLVFNPVPPPDVVQGSPVNGVVVQVLDGANNPITSDNTTQVTLTVDDSCGNTGIVLGTLTVSGGSADFSGLGQKFYTLATGLNIQAAANDGTSTAASSINVVANSDMIFPDGFEDCRL